MVVSFNSFACLSCGRRGAVVTLLSQLDREPSGVQSNKWIHMANPSLSDEMNEPFPRVAVFGSPLHVLPTMLFSVSLPRYQFVTCLSNSSSSFSLRSFDSWPLSTNNKKKSVWLGCIAVLTLCSPISFHEIGNIGVHSNFDNIILELWQ